MYENLKIEIQEIILWILPPSKTWYKRYYDIIFSKELIGEGRWGKGDLIFGDKNQIVDLNDGMKPVVSIGEVLYSYNEKETSISISIHEPSEDGMVELQISEEFFEFFSDINKKNNFIEKHKWTLSSWELGENCPATNSKVRTVFIDEIKSHALVISSEKKILWLHNKLDGMNSIIPISSYYNALMMNKQIQDPNKVLHPTLFFVDVNNYTDSDLIIALNSYNKQQRRFPVNMISDSFLPTKQKSLISKIKNIFIK